MNLPLTAIISHSVTIIVLSAMALLILRKQGRDVIDRLFLAILLSFISWIGFDLAARIFLSRDILINAVSSLAGVSVQAVALSSYWFCEFFPDNKPLPGYRLRLKAVSAVSLLISPWAFSTDWITDRRYENGIVESTIGVLFYVLSIYAIVVVLAGIALVLYKYTRVNEKRLRIHIRYFLLASGLTLIFVVTFSFIMPVIGMGRFFFIGPDASLIMLAVMVHAILTQRMFDLRTVTIRFALKAVASILFSATVYFSLLILFFSGQMTDSGGINYWSMSWPVLVFMAILFLAGMQYGRHLQPLIDRFFFRPAPSADQILQNMLHSRLWQAEYYNSTGLFERVLYTLDSFFPVEKALLIGLDVPGQAVQARLGEKTAVIEPPLLRFFNRLLKLRTWPPAVYKELNTITLVAAPNRLPLSAVSREFRRIFTGLQKVIIQLQKEDFELMIPLFSREKLSGILLLGTKRDNTPFYSREIRLLDAVRMALALALDNYHHYITAFQQKQRAEEEAAALSRLLLQSKPVSQSIGGNTLVYRGPHMQQVLDLAGQYAGFEQPVLITGETGTGKELIASYLHEHSAGEKKLPFTAVNCAAIPATIWEDEIFGHRKGAFTDARTDRKGKIEMAGRGSLFLDEIGEMPLEMQAKLLRVLQERQFFPLGSSTALTAECRFIFATNRDLEEMVNRGTFRADLYYRINVFALELPPLRERTSDIDALADWFISKFNSQLGFNVTGIDEAARRLLRRYYWPGNIRELENTLLRAVANCSGQLEVRHLPEAVKNQAGQPAWRPGRRSGARNLDFENLVNHYRKDLIERALVQSQGNKTRAAELLGIKRGRLLYQIKELKIE